jgi:micrococcal nuclease
MSQPFPSVVWRAQPLYVVDGDTVDLFVDRGMRHFAVLRFRLIGVDTPELRSRDAAERVAAQDARSFVQDWIGRAAKTWMVNLKEWPLKITTAKSDSFGRWLCEIEREDGATIGAALLEAGHAVVYR